jgi:hypothetical protein
MHTATKRTLVAGAALAAAGLLGSLPYHGPVQAQGIPTQHHDVALVDLGDTIVGSETSLDDSLFTSVFGPSGVEAELYNGLATALGGGTSGDNLATALLDATGGSPIYSADFDGALSRLAGGTFFDTWASEDQVNQLLGVSATESQTLILADIEKDFIPIPTSTGLTDGDLSSAIGTSTFDTDLTQIANADFTTATGDFEGWLANLPTALADLGGGSGDLGGLSTLIGDLTGDLTGGTTGDGLSFLTGDLGTLLTDLGSALF